MFRNSRLAMFAVAWALLASPAAAMADTAEQRDVPLPAPVVETLAAVAPQIADWPAAGQQPRPTDPPAPASALRGSVDYQEEAVWVTTLSSFCATERRVTVDLYSSLAADITVHVYDDDRTVARRRLLGAMDERTVTLALELRRGGSYRLEVTAQRYDEPTIRFRRRLVVRSACRQ